MSGEVGKALGEAIGKVAPEAYTDLVKPTATELGKAAGTVTGLLNVALSPIRLVTVRNKLWEESVNKALEERFKGREDKIVEPDPQIAMPTIQWLSVTYDCEVLREMFLNLLATSMDADRRDIAHPSYAEIIRQLSPDEARLLMLLTERLSFDMWSVTVTMEQALSEAPRKITSSMTYKRSVAATHCCESIQTFEANIANLQRLNLIELQAHGISSLYSITPESLRQHIPFFDVLFPEVVTVLGLVDASDEIVAVGRAVIQCFAVTWAGPFALGFARACLGYDNEPGWTFQLEPQNGTTDSSNETG